MLKKTQEALRKSEEQFRLVMEAVKDCAIVMLDVNGLVVVWNGGAALHHGFAADEIIGKNFSCFYSSEDIARAWPAHELQRAQTDGPAEDEGWRIRKDGTQFWGNTVITALVDLKGKLRGFSNVTHDASERKQAEVESEYMRQLSAKVLDVRDQERKQIATELLENVAQYVAAAGLYVSSAGGGGELEAPSAQMQRFADKAKESLRQYSAEIRVMADDLYPQTLDYFGLTTAIERFVDSFKERHGIEVSVSIPPSLPRLPAKHELALYRVVEEALKNVLMHSGSKAAEVRVNYDAEEIELDVLDAGGGMPLSEEFAPGGNSKGTGIHEMQQRMRSIGGELLITSGRDGTKVIAVLPFVPRPSEVLA